ncbi:hypothetical protein PIB30_049020 [Stylosanthes scabra]|uniref:Uncharacterized protein n=1 Tax=Stylosanthes scabra TaxID=79078 RepID=A0ABU6RHZ0_9FABA|nr:hypothetical protein [Stylosanthes scabra]
MLAGDATVRVVNGGFGGFEKGVVTVIFENDERWQAGFEHVVQLRDFYFDATLFSTFVERWRFFPPPVGLIFKVTLIDPVERSVNSLKSKTPARLNVEQDSILTRGKKIGDDEGQLSINKFGRKTAKKFGLQIIDGKD